MNYIQELNAFYEWTETNPLPPSALNLWHALMHINNKCRWNAEFTAAISTLMAKTGSQYRSIFSARKILADSGRLIWTSNGSQKSATYRLIPFGSENQCDNLPENPSGDLSGNLSGNRENPPSDSHDPNTGQCIDADKKGPCNCTHSRIQTAPISKQNKTKQNINKEPKGSMSSCDDPARLIRKIFDDFNEICRNLPTAKVLTSRRAQMVGARLHEHGYETIRQMLLKAGASNFLAGANNRKWTATFDWLFGPCNFAKVLEGNYDNGRFMKTEKSGFVGKPSPIELLEEVYNNIQEDGRLDQ